MLLLRTMIIMSNQTTKKDEKVADAYVEALKQRTRAMIVFQLLRNPEMTATEISKALGEDVDVVYYHMKSLKALKMVSKPRVEVRGNYLEKYYSLAPDVRRRFTEVDKSANKKWGEMAPEEYRQILMTAFAHIKSVVVGSANQVEKADTRIIEKLSKRKDYSIRVFYCTKEQYYEFLDDLKKVSWPPYEKDASAKRDYVIAILAMPKLDEE